MTEQVARWSCLVATWCAHEISPIKNFKYKKHFVAKIN